MSRTLFFQVAQTTQILYGNGLQLLSASRIIFRKTDAFLQSKEIVKKMNASIEELNILAKIDHI